MASCLHIINKTAFSPESLLERAVHKELPATLHVMIRYMRQDARTPYSGLYLPDKRLIRVSVNRNNIYPLLYQFYTRVYRKDPADPGRYWRGLSSYYLPSGEVLILAVFLHELSHYYDHQDGLNLNRKETKADQFSYKSLLRLQRKTGGLLLIHPESAARRRYVAESQISLPLECATDEKSESFTSSSER